LEFPAAPWGGLIAVAALLFLVLLRSAEAHPGHHHPVPPVGVPAELSTPAAENETVGRHRGGPHDGSDPTCPICLTLLVGP
jgi:hypothetical protein